MLYLSCRVKRHAHSSNSPRIIEWRGFSKNDGQSSPAVRLPIPSCDSKTRLERSTPNPSWDLCWKYLGIPPSLVQTEYQMLVSVEMVGAFLSTSCMHIWYPLVAPRGGPAPEIVDPSGCFPEGPDPPIPILSISEWIKSRGPSLAFVNQTFFANTQLGQGNQYFGAIWTFQNGQRSGPSKYFGHVVNILDIHFLSVNLMKHGPPGF